MPSQTVPKAAESAKPIPYEDHAHHLAYQLFELHYAAQAAHALLREHDDCEASEILTGVGYLLRKLARECEAMQESVSNSASTYTLPK